jgi:NADH-ubiquinone oxidoreductase chain 6
MLINVRISELSSNTSNSIPLAVIISLSFTYPLYEILPSSLSTLSIYNTYSSIINIFKGHNIDVAIDEFIFDHNYVYNKSITGIVTAKSWDGNISEYAHISSIGNIMYTSYAVWLIITSIILLLAMIGAIVITIKQK